jgi:prepilin-type processing-associated H-X9-DG protein
MHNNACGYGFADGHSEIKKWNHEMKSNITFGRSWSPRGKGAKADWLWLASGTICRTKEIRLAAH